MARLSQKPLLEQHDFMQALIGAKPKKEEAGSQDEPEIRGLAREIETLQAISVAYTQRPLHSIVDSVGSSALANSHLFSRYPMSTPSGSYRAIELRGETVLHLEVSHVGVPTGVNYAMFYWMSTQVA